MTTDVADPGRPPGRRARLPRWLRPLGGGPLLTVASTLALAAAAVSLFPQRYGEALPLVPAAVAVAASRFGCAAGLWALGSAVAAVTFDLVSRSWPSGAHATDLLGLATSAVGGGVVLACLARQRRDASASAARAAASRRACDAQGTLLSELGHRIRNDLAALQATATLLAAVAQSADARAALSDMSGRIRLFGCIYRRLSPDPTASFAVGMRDFLGEFCSELREVHLTFRPVGLDLEVGDVALPPGRAILVGLVLNEGVTNALKHAFPGGLAGRIAVRFDRGDPGWLVLTIADDGAGLPPAIMRGRGLGTRLLDALASQLDGGLTLEMLEGRTVLSLRFPG